MSALDDTAWTYVTRRFVGLGADFAVRTTDASLGRYLDRAYAAMASGGSPGNLYSLWSPPEGAPGNHGLAFGNEILTETAHPWLPIEYLAWHVNRTAIDGGEGYVMVHAAAVERHGAAVIITGPPESGKTTLAAGLVHAGFRYLSDEIAAVNPAEMTVHPFPKPLSVGRGSWHVLRGLAPPEEGGIRHYFQRQWHVPPSSVGDSTDGSAPPPRMFIVTHYEPGGPTTLEPIRRSEIMPVAIEQTFRFREHPRHNLLALAALLERCDCYRLHVTDLGHACELVLTAMSDAMEGATRSA